MLLLYGGMCNSDSLTTSMCMRARKRQGGNKWHKDKKGPLRAITKERDMSSILPKSTEEHNEKVMGKTMRGMKTTDNEL